MPRADEARAGRRNAGEAHGADSVRDGEEAVVDDVTVEQWPQADVPDAHGDEVPDYTDGLTWDDGGREASDDDRTDGEVMADARAKEQFPTLMSAFANTPPSPRRAMSARERRAARRAFKHDLKAASKKGKQANREAKAATRAERKQYKSVSRQLKERDRELSDRSDRQRQARRRAGSVYGAIGFDRMFANGVCEVEEGLYSETVEFTDVSYQSAIEETQKATFNSLAQLLDYFGSDTMVQYSVSNTPIPEEEVGNRAFFDEATAGANAPLARQFNAILNQKMLDGCSNICRTRHITYATSAPDPVRAERLLARMRATVFSQLAKTRSQARLLGGRERLGLVSHVLRPGKPFDFEYERDLSVRSPLTAKDFVCPTSLDFRPDGGDATCFRSEGTWCQVLVVRPDFASEVMDRAISDILDLPIPMVVTWHLQPIDKAKSVAMVKRQAAWIQKEVIDNQRKAVGQGFDMSILPPELEETRSENERVLDQILHANQRLYYFCGLAFTYADTREALDDQVVQLVRTAHAEGIELATLDLRQREGLNSVLPLAHNHVDVVRDHTTTEATVLMPFTTQELDMEGGGYYGQNQLSGNLVICNRKRLMSPHGFVCGMSGSGKSFSVKREIENTILSNPGDEVYIMDVTGEYSYQVACNHGVELAFGPDSTNHMNPLDMADASGLSRQAALAWKIDALLAMTSALKAEGGQDLTQEERSIVSACAEATYRECADGETPVLGDFVDHLKRVQGAGQAEARRLALVFGRYVSGPMGFLNHQSDVTFGTSRLTSFNTRDVPADMRVFTMLANLESVRQRMFQNHERGVATWLYIDEIQSLFGHPAIIGYLARLWREGRKFGLICTGMTQSASAMGAGGEAATIIDQSGFLFLLRQSDVDRAFWAKARTLSAQEEGYISETARRGQGLLIADAARVGITDDFPKGNDLYDMFSTSPEDYARRLERERREGKRQ